MAQLRDHQAIAKAVSEGHDFFYKCPKARNGVQQKSIDYEPAFAKHAKLKDRADDERLP